MQYSRKEFLQLMGAGALATGASTTLSAQPMKDKAVKKAGHPLTLGLASYSLRTLALPDVIKVANQLQLKSIALKSMHMPLDGSTEEINRIAKQVRDGGLDLYGAGVIYMKSEDEVNNAFAYAKTAGLKIIIGVPNHDLLSLVEERVKETNIKVAIHNHGPGDKVYPSLASVYEKIKTLDSRIGMCIDIGHAFRIGEDPVAGVKKYVDRLHDVHIKDVDKVGKEGKSQELGRGIMDIPAFLKVLRKIKYTGVVGMEYEKNGKDPVPGLAESTGYVQGVLDVLG